MLLNPALIERSVTKAAHSKFDPVKVEQTLGEGERSKRTTAEQRARRYSEFLTETGSAPSARAALERLLGGNDLTPINYLERGLLAARSVCRIRLRDPSGSTSGFGTGFLVGPGVLMTNHHVISGAADAQGAAAEFDYELDVRGQEKLAITFDVRLDPAPIALERLDFCLVSVAPSSSDGRPLDDFGWLPLNPAPGKAVVGEYLTIIQHPGGERKQICVRENKLLKYDEGGDTLWYNTDTVAGSSGSPVFNNSWQVVALHHSGVPKKDQHGRWLTVDGALWDPSMDESRVAWLANEGIRVSRILEYLTATHAGHPLAHAVLQQLIPPWRETLRRADGETHLEIPIRVSVRVGGESRRAFSAAPATDTGLASRKFATGIEKVEVDQSDYDARIGYYSDFLGTDELTVPLPTIKSTSLKDQVLTFGTGKKTSELKYWNYSVMMHRHRKLAILSAVNVDANQRPEGAGRDGDRWFFDTRIAEDQQLGPEFYGEQKTFEVDRSRNPFDRGHLTRRLDAQWGRNQPLAKRNGDDSFHWTNCAPQHWRFNQGSKRWLGLEEYVIKSFASSTGRASVLNGPVFDAPLSKEGPDGRIVPTLDGQSHQDPVFGGVAIPKLFFKIVACSRDNGALAVAAFLMSQEDFLASVDRLKGMGEIEEERLSTAEAKLYQVRVTDIEMLTGLDFGPLKAADTGVLEGIAAASPRIIGALKDIRLTSASWSTVGEKQSWESEEQ